MPLNPAVAAILHEMLATETGISERKMFGGLCLMKDGNMLCGTLTDGAMFRVGKAHETTALGIPGAARMTFTSRPMGGFIELVGPGWQDETARRALLDLALDFVGTLPPK